VYLNIPVYVTGSLPLSWQLCSILWERELNNFLLWQQKNRAETQIQACIPCSLNSHYFWECRMDGWVSPWEAQRLTAGHGGLGILRMSPGPGYEASHLVGWGPMWSGHYWACMALKPVATLQTHRALEAQLC
jgi:hypothetical protein